MSAALRRTSGARRRPVGCWRRSAAASRVSRPGASRAEAERRVVPLRPAFPSPPRAGWRRLSAPVTAGRGDDRRPVRLAVRSCALAPRRRQFGETLLLQGARAPRTRTKPVRSVVQARRRAWRRAALVVAVAWKRRGRPLRRAGKIDAGRHRRRGRPSAAWFPVRRQMRASAVRPNWRGCARSGESRAKSFCPIRSRSRNLSPTVMAARNPGRQ
jgi:hypothetical protein